MPRRWQCWRRVAGRTAADLAITTKKLVIFRRREFSTPPSTEEGGGDDHSFSFSTHATEWAWDYGADGERRAAFITLMSGRYLSSQRPKVAPSAVKTRPTAARRQRENSISRFIIISAGEPKNFNEQFDKKWARQSEQTRRGNDRVLLVVFGGGGGLGSFYLSRGKALEAVGGHGAGCGPRLPW